MREARKKGVNYFENKLILLYPLQQYGQPTVRLSSAPSLQFREFAGANEQLGQFPNAALSTEIARLTEEAKQTPGRPEGGNVPK